MVLNEICDDYENVDQIILPHIVKIGVKFGLTIERSEVVGALAGLIADEMAKACLLSGWKPYVTELPGMPSLDVIEEDFETYFLITNTGLRTKKEMDGLIDTLYPGKDPWWPYDDD